MPDAMDRLQDFNDEHLADSLARHAARPVRVGRTTCANLDCGEPIGTHRTAQGAQLCDECEVDDRKRQAHFAVWARR